MSQTEKLIQCYCRLPADAVKDLNEWQDRLGFESRTEMVQTILITLLEELNTGGTTLFHQAFTKFKENSCTNNTISDEEINSRLRKLIEELARPIIARKGADHAFRSIGEDIQTTFYEETGIQLTKKKIRIAFRNYELTNKTTLREYRKDILTKKEE